MPVDYFGEDVAVRYDDDAVMFDPAVVDPMVDLLAELAGEGAALEFGIGTGRIAVPLAARGVPVHGIDLSQAMVARLRVKPGAEQIAITIGDFATTRVEGTFSLVYLVFNTIGNLTTQNEQVACFENAARHLHPGGYFVIELGFDGGRRGGLSVFDLSDTHVGVDEYDAATQRLVSHHFSLVDGRWERLSIPFRAVGPGELDLMARMAGMSLSERWSGWTREPFTSQSSKHISVWEKT
jgi:SAM-dependent methyltransferase